MDKNMKPLQSIHQKYVFKNFFLQIPYDFYEYRV